MRGPVLVSGAGTCLQGCFAVSAEHCVGSICGQCLWRAASDEICSPKRDD